MRRFLLLVCLLPMFLSAESRWEFVRQFGGSGEESLAGMVRDAEGNLYVAGATRSLDFPADGHQVQPSAAGLNRLEGGREWQPVTTLDAQYTFSAAASPSSPGVLYVITEQGLHKTADDGATWDLLPLTWRQDGATTGLAVDPTDGDVLYATSYTNGAFRSTDGGRTWQRRSEGMHSQDSPGQFPDLLRIDPHRPSTVYAMSRRKSLPVYLTDNGGESWHEIRPFVMVALDPVQAGLIYGADSRSVWRSRDRGSTWEQVLELSNFGQMLVDSRGNLYVADQGDPTLLVSHDQGESWGEGRLNGQLIFELAADPYGPGVFALAGYHTREIFFSTDGFATWRVAGPQLSNSSDGLAVASAPGREPDLYITGAASSDGFLAKFDAGGETVWSTYFGGASDDEIVAVDTDATGNVYIAGRSRGSAAPVTAGAYSAGADSGGFVAKFTASGTLVYAAQVTGSLSVVTNMAVDADGGVYVTGKSLGEIPTTPGVVRPHMKTGLADPAGRRRA